MTYVHVKERLPKTRPLGNQFPITSSFAILLEQVQNSINVTVYYKYSSTRICFELRVQVDRALILVNHKYLLIQVAS